MRADKRTPGLRSGEFGVAGEQVVIAPNSLTIFPSESRVNPVTEGICPGLEVAIESPATVGTISVKRR